MNLPIPQAPAVPVIHNEFGEGYIFRLSSTDGDFGLLGLVRFQANRGLVAGWFSLMDPALLVTDVSRLKALSDATTNNPHHQ